MSEKWHFHHLDVDVEDEARSMSDRITRDLRRAALTPEQIAQLGKPLNYVPAPPAPSSDAVVDATRPNARLSPNNGTYEQLQLLERY